MPESKTAVEPNYCWRCGHVHPWVSPCQGTITTTSRKREVVDSNRVD